MKVNPELTRIDKMKLAASAGMAVFCLQASAQIIQCPAILDLKSSRGFGDGPLALSSAKFGVSYNADPISWDIPYSSKELRKRGIEKLFTLPINPDVVVFSCIYGANHSIELLIPVPKQAKFCWLAKDGAERYEAKCDDRSPISSP